MKEGSGTVPLTNGSRKPENIRTGSGTVLLFSFITSVADPGSVIFLTPGFGIGDAGWVKIQVPGSGSGINIPDHISESLETIFGLKILKFFYVDPESF